MKKWLLLIIILFMPTIVFGHTFDINTKINLNGKKISNGEFTIELRNYKDEVVMTTTNDKDGNVVFKNVETEMVDTFKNSQPYMNIFIMNIKKNKSGQYTIPNDTIYVGVYFDENEITEISYLKNLDNHYAKTKKTGKSIFHAKDSDLVGEAFVEVDKDTGILTIFRDDVGKYTNEEEIGNKIYFTGVEDNSIYINDYIRSLVTRFIVKDPIKLSSRASFFEAYLNLEEYEGLDKVDSSNVTSMKDMFIDNRKVKIIDLSTWDTSKVTDFSFMFNYCEELETVYLDNFDTSKATNIGYMFQNCSKLKSVNIDSFNFNSLEYGAMLFKGTAIEAYDFSGKTMPETAHFDSIGIDSGYVRYIDYSTVKYIVSSEFYGMSCLNVLKLQHSRTDFYNYNPSSSYISFPTSLDRWNSYWYFPNNKRIFDASQIQYFINTGYMYGFSGHPDADDRGYLYPELDFSMLVRPKCNTNMEEFDVLYKKIDVSVNPKTLHNTVIVFCVVLLCFIGFGILYSVKKRKVFY